MEAIDIDIWNCVNRTCVTLRDVRFQATENHVSLFIDDEIADKLAYKIQCYLQGKDLARNDLTNDKKVVE